MKKIKFPPPATNFWSLLLLIFSVLYSFSGIFFGLDFTDSFYHLNQALYPADGIFLYPFFLSSVIIMSIIELAGTSILALRIINWLLLVSSMILPFIVVKVKIRKPVIILYFALALILYTPFNANILGYDTLSIFINSLLFSLTTVYLKVRKNYILILLAIFGAMAIMIRLPNILAVPVIFIFILVSERMDGKKWNLNQFLKPGFFLLTTFLVTVAGLALYYNSFEEFYAASSNTNSHDLLSLFLNYFRDAVKIMGYAVLFFAGMFVYRRAAKKSGIFFNEGLLVVFFLLSLYFLVGISKYSASYSILLVAIAICLVVVHIVQYKGSGKSFQYLTLWLFLSFIFINPLGSNTGLIKAYSLLLLLPFVISLHKIKYKSYWLILFIILLPFSIMTKVFGIYEDKNLTVLNKKPEIEELTPILTNFRRKEYLQKTDVLVQELKSRRIEVFFYGDKSHIFHYLYPETSLNISSFFQPVDNLAFFNDFLKKINNRSKVAVFIIDSYPENSRPKAMSLWEMEMIKNNFEKMNSGSLKYFLKIEN